MLPMSCPFLAYCPYICHMLSCQIIATRVRVLRRLPAYFTPRDTQVARFSNPLARVFTRQASCPSCPIAPPAVLLGCVFGHEGREQNADYMPFLLVSPLSWRPGATHAGECCCNSAGMLITKCRVLSILFAEKCTDLKTYPTVTQHRNKFQSITKVRPAFLPPKGPPARPHTRTKGDTRHK
jgi:hypothetical protein